MMFLLYYFKAALILKQVTGIVRFLVVNPNDEVEARNKLGRKLGEEIHAFAGNGKYQGKNIISSCQKSVYIHY